MGFRTKISVLIFWSIVLLVFLKAINIQHINSSNSGAGKSSETVTKRVFSKITISTVPPDLTRKSVGNYSYRSSLHSIEIHKRLLRPPQVTL